MKGSAFLPILIAGTTPIILIGLIAFGSTLGLVAWKPPILWTHEFGDPTLASEVDSAAVDNGDLYVGGSLNSTFGYGTPFLRDYNAFGSTSWTNYFRNASGFVGGISIASDGVYALQFKSKNETFLRYGFNGNELWSQPMDQGVTLLTTFPDDK